MAEKTAQERYADVRKSLVEVGQHGIAWQLDQAWLAARNEHAAELKKAVDDAVAKEEGADLSDDVIPYEPIDVPVIIEAQVPGPGQDGAGGGASSQAGVEDKSALPGGVIA